MDEIDIVNFDSSVKGVESLWQEKIRPFRSSKKIVFAVVLIGVIVDSLFYSIIVPIMPFYLKELQVSEVMIGFLFSWYSIALFLSSVPSVYIVNNFGKRKAMVFSIGLLFFSTIFYAFAKSYLLLVVARGLQGASSAITWTSGISLINDFFPIEEQGKIYGILDSAMAFGSLCGPLFGGILYQWSGRKEVPFLIASVFVAIDFFGRLFIEESRKETAPEETKEGFSQLIKNPKIVVVSIANLFSQGVSAGIDPVLPLYLAQFFNLSPGSIGVMTAVILISMSASAIFAGRFIDNHPTKRAHVMALGILLLSFSVALLFVTKNLYFEIFLLCLFGIGDGFIVSPQTPEINSICEEKFDGKYIATGSAFVNISFSIGAILGPLSFSYFYSVVGHSVDGIIHAAVLLALFFVFILGYLWSSRRG